MNITQVRLAFKSLYGDWVNVVTGSGAAIVVLVISYVPLGQSHPWIPWLTFVLIWSYTWGRAFVRSWNREHRKAFILAREFLMPELERVRHNASAGPLVFSSEDRELDFYYQKLDAASRGIDKEFLKEALAMWKQQQPIVSGTQAGPIIWRA